MGNHRSLLAHGPSLDNLLVLRSAHGIPLPIVLLTKSNHRYLDQEALANDRPDSKHSTMYGWTEVLLEVCGSAGCPRACGLAY